MTRSALVLASLAALAVATVPAFAAEPEAPAARETANAPKADAAPAAAPAAKADAPAAAPADAPKAKPASFTIGSVAPSTDLEMAGVDGKKSSIAGVKGETGTLVVFTCNHCPFVKAWQDRLVSIANGCVSRGVGVLFVNSNDPSIVPEDGLVGMKQLAATKGYKFPYVIDEGGRLARAFGAVRTPEVYLFDKDLKLIYHGAVDDNAEDAAAVKQHYLGAALISLMQDQPVAVKETKAIGCGIKLKS